MGLEISCRVLPFIKMPGRNDPRECIQYIPSELVKIFLYPVGKDVLRECKVAPESARLTVVSRWNQVESYWLNLKRKTMNERIQ